MIELNLKLEKLTIVSSRVVQMPGQARHDNIPCCHTGLDPVSKRSTINLRNRITEPRVCCLAGRADK
jgi:hypothetical protein